MNGTATRAQKKDYNNWYKLTIHFSTHENVDVTEEFFDSLCAPFGIIGDTIIRSHQRSHTPHFVLSGYGVVFFQEQPGANRALQALHGQVIQGLHLSCTLSPRPNDVLHLQQSQRGLHHLSVGHPSPYLHPSVASPAAAPYGDVYRGSPRHHHPAIQQTLLPPSSFIHSSVTTQMAQTRVSAASSPRHFAPGTSSAPSYGRHSSAHDSTVSAVAAYLAAQQQQSQQQQPQQQSQQLHAQHAFQHLQLKQIDTSGSLGAYGLDYDARPPSGSSSPVPPHQSAARHPALASYQQQVQQQRMKQLMSHYMAPLPTVPPSNSLPVRSAQSHVCRHGASAAPQTHSADDRFSLAPVGSTAGMLTAGIPSLASVSPASSSVFTGEAYFASPPPLTAIPAPISSSGSFSSGATTALGHSSGSLSASSAVTVGGGPSFPTLYTSKQPQLVATNPSVSLSSSFSSQPSHSSSQLHFQQLIEGRVSLPTAASLQKSAALTSLDQLLDATAGVTLVDDADAVLSNPSSFYVPRGETAPYALGQQLHGARHALQQVELASHSQSAADLVSTLLASNSFSTDNLSGAAGATAFHNEVIAPAPIASTPPNGSTLDSIIDDDSAPVASSDY